MCNSKYQFWWPMMTNLKFYLRASSNSALETSSMPWFSVSSIDHLCRIDWFATSWACIGWRQLPPHLGIIDIYLCIYYVTSCVLPFLLFIDLSCVCNWSLELKTLQVYTKVWLSPFTGSQEVKVLRKIERYVEARILGWGLLLEKYIHFLLFDILRLKHCCWLA